MRRFEMRLPAIVRMEGVTEFQTETQNVSARGVFFYFDQHVSTGTKLEITLTFPPHVTLTEAVRVRFFARVIRVENPTSSVRVGVAVMIENYEFLHSNLKRLPARHRKFRANRSMRDVEPDVNLWLRTIDGVEVEEDDAE